MDGAVQSTKAYEQAGVNALWLAGDGTQEEVFGVHAAVRLSILMVSGGDLTRHS